MDSYPNTHARIDTKNLDLESYDSTITMPQVFSSSSSPSSVPTAGGAVSITPELFEKVRIARPTAGLLSSGKAV